MRFQQAVDLSAGVPCDADDGDRIIMHRSEYLYSPGIRWSSVLQSQPRYQSHASALDSGPDEYCGEDPCLDQSCENGSGHGILGSTPNQFAHKPKQNPEQDDEMNDQHQKCMVPIHREHSPN